jgi:hypothetical protein
MTYDEFSDKFQEIKEEFKRIKGFEMSTVFELENYLLERKNRRLSRGLKSLKGINI